MRTILYNITPGLICQATDQLGMPAARSRAHPEAGERERDAGWAQSSADRMSSRSQGHQGEEVLGVGTARARGPLPKSSAAVEAASAEPGERGPGGEAPAFFALAPGDVKGLLLGPGPLWGFVVLLLPLTWLLPPSQRLTATSTRFPRGPLLDHSLLENQRGWSSGGAHAQPPPPPLPTPR